jgi:hypothetical protein
MCKENPYNPYRWRESVSLNAALYWTAHDEDRTMSIVMLMTEETLRFKTLEDDGYRHAVSSCLTVPYCDTSLSRIQDGVDVNHRLLHSWHQAPRIDWLILRSRRRLR